MKVVLHDNGNFLLCNSNLRFCPIRDRFKWRLICGTALWISFPLLHSSFGEHMSVHTLKMVRWFVRIYDTKCDNIRSHLTSMPIAVWPHELRSSQSILMEMCNWKANSNYIRELWELFNCWVNTFSLPRCHTWNVQGVLYMPFKNTPMATK